MGKIGLVDQNTDGSEILSCPASATSHNQDCSNDLSNIVGDTQANEKNIASYKIWHSWHPNIQRTSKQWTHQEKQFLSKTYDDDVNYFEQLLKFQENSESLEWCWLPRPGNPKKRWTWRFLKLWTELTIPLWRSRAGRSEKNCRVKATYSRQLSKKVKNSSKLIGQLLMKSQVSWNKSLPDMEILLSITTTLIEVKMKKSVDALHKVNI